jgi:hypothetical protein
MGTPFHPHLSALYQSEFGIKKGTKHDNLIPLIFIVVRPAGFEPAIQDSYSIQLLTSLHGGAHMKMLRKMRKLLLSLRGSV